MGKPQLKEPVRNAIYIGGMCSLSYLAVYFARNILSAVSPQMIGDGVFTTENIGTLSSVYFITYAFGQLINGAIGDKIKAKYMIGFGLALAGVCNCLFSLMAGCALAAYICYGLTGFCLAMIYGPMTKLVAENTEPVYATRCSLGYTFASFIGSPMAGMAAVVLSWQGVFHFCSATLVVMGVVCFAVFQNMERKGIISYGRFKRTKQEGGGIKVLLRYRIVKFTLISIITGVIRTTVIFWMPTYLVQHLGFSAEDAALIFTAATFIFSLSTFIAVFIYELLKQNMDLTLLLSFAVSVAGFVGVYVLKQPMMNVVAFVQAILACDCAASMLWSRYCPSLRDTGMVSGATGFLDFVSYSAASVSSTLFANSVSTIGWSGLILVWLGLMVFGVVICLPVKKRRS